ncbi:Helix-loop-helix DNA-binding domain containing protein [Brugia malayi]|uniref:BMA-CKY-1 n=2 Tax=Brugia TaxID=6278 RepID=A0A0H5S9Q6_BRUMA|nr:Helix-loop-helix DNA-binding domain containing protein [Brugia malayi]CRZ25104.1 BMA-CKY-1 [Brugia malayi]VIO99049.1 Helix-loop-helix DNA-binding domain containing protein [Brugia malayi]
MNQIQRQSSNNNRSTRGASKYRRDQINLEIQKLRDLLPLTDSMRKRLFQLQVMSLACIYIRKQNYLPHVIGMGIQTSFRSALKQSESFRALRGFLLMMTKCGKIVYISDNASDYLGHSVAEIMCQGDSVYDLIDHRDHGRIQAELMSGPPSVSDQNFFPSEKVFICRMNLSRTTKRQLQYHKYTLMEGRYLHTSDYYTTHQSLSAPLSHIQPLFAAYCEMLINPENVETLSAGNTSIFCTIHSMDLKFVHVDHMTAHYLGYKNEEVIDKSWYQFLHPDHLFEVAYKHRILSQRKDGAVMCLLRLQMKNCSWLWLHTVFTVKNNLWYETAHGKRMRHLIYITYQVLNEVEALSLQGNLWIYGIRNELMVASFDHVMDSHEDSDVVEEQMSKQYASPILSSLLAIKKESLSGDSREFNHFSGNFKDLNTNESKITDLDFGNDDESSELEALPELCLERNIKGPLPDLSGDLDKFFEEMEHSKMQSIHSSTMIKLPENVECISDQLSPTLPFDTSLRAYNCKMPTIAKLLQGHFDDEDSYESIQKRTRTDEYMQLTDNLDVQLIM